MDEQRPSEKISKPIPVPDEAKGRRDAIRETVKRYARGNVQLARGDFLLPEDKDLSTLKNI